MRLILVLFLVGIAVPAHACEEYYNTLSALERTVGITPQPRTAASTSPQINNINRSLDQLERAMEQSASIKKATKMKAASSYIIRSK